MQHVLSCSCGANRCGNDGMSFNRKAKVVVDRRWNVSIFADCCVSVANASRLQQI